MSNSNKVKRLRDASEPTLRIATWLAIIAIAGLLAYLLAVTPGRG